MCVCMCLQQEIIMFLRTTVMSQRDIVDVHMCLWLCVALGFRAGISERTFGNYKKSVREN